MRPDVDEARVRQLLDALGRRVRTAHTLYLVGGSSAVLVGWRMSTRDVDVRPEPDSAAELQAGFDAMQAKLFRFPAVDAAKFRARVADVAGRC